MAIVKILSRHSPTYATLVRYVLQYAGNEVKTRGTIVYTQNLRSDSVDGYIREFIENEAFRRTRRKDSISLYHEIISFNSIEKRHIFTQGVIEDLAHEYMRLRGDKAVILAYPHFDQSHIHLHFCVSALQYRTGISAGLSKQKLQELKLAFQHYHKEHYPELTKSEPQHGRGGAYLTHGQWHAKRSDEIAHIIQQCFDMATTQNDFLASLRDAGLHHYERNGIPTGIAYKGAKFRFSRLLGERELDSLPIDRSEEERALAEIRVIRKRQLERDGRSREVEDRER